MGLWPARPRAAKRVPSASNAVRRRSRLIRGVTASIGVALLAVAVTSTVSVGRASAQVELDGALSAEASLSAAKVSEYFDRAHSISLLLAHSSAFTGLEPGTTSRTAAETVAAEAEATAALAYLEELYPDRISEACLINSDGRELARVVAGEVALSSELSAEEAEAPFFAPTMALVDGQVHQGEPYLSPDTGVWVIASSTPLVGADGTTWGMVHFEVTLESFRNTIDFGRQGHSASIVDTATGRILLEPGVQLTPSGLGRDGSVELTALLADGPGNANPVGDHRAAFSAVRVSDTNPNAWAIVVAAPAASTTWSSGLGPAALAMSLAALVLLAFAGLNLRSSHRELREASLTDELTGLMNRRHLTERISHAMVAAQRDRGRCAILLIDLDRFKEINDTLGHHHGDELLRAVADRLTATFRGSDKTVSRLGGDEFAVLLATADEPTAMLLARRGLAELHKPFIIEGLALSIEASVGIALAPLHANDGNGLLRAADVAMYEAKERRSGAVVYDPAFDSHTPTRLSLLGDLRRALQRDELFMIYQPKVNLRTGTAHSVEALVRWHHPTRGLVPPDDFIPVAEGTGLIMPLTLHTLDLSIAQARRWLDDGHPIQVAVNLSPRCLLDANLPELVQALLDQHGLPARLLRLEVTENTIMTDPVRALGILSELQQSGISLSIDDFGTGYSSMTYLKRLPVDELKIDRSFITNMLANGSDGVLVRSSIDLGHNLGMTVVAEGVEDQATLTALADLGCDIVQGYHLGRPMSAPDIDAWLQARTDHEERAALAAAGLTVD